MSQPAGHSGTPWPRKLGIGDGDAVALIGAPEWLEDLLGEVPSVAQLHTDLDGDALFDVIVVFVSWRAELEAELRRPRARMAPACGLWVAWPKKAAKVPTDMSDNVIREVALPTGLVDNKVCAIDETWSALRLVIRGGNRKGARFSSPAGARPRTRRASPGTARARPRSGRGSTCCRPRPGPGPGSPRRPDPASSSSPRTGPRRWRSPGAARPRSSP